MNKMRKIYHKIKCFIDKLLGKDKKLLIEDNLNELESVFSNSEFEPLHSKEDYLLMYNNIKKGIISPNELMLDDLIKVMMLMYEEVNILEQKIEDEELELQQLDIEIESLTRQLNNFKKQE